MKDYQIDRAEFTASSDWSVSNALHMMKLSYAVYAGTTDNIGAEEDWSITKDLVTSAGYEIAKFEYHDLLYEPNAMVCWDADTAFLIFRGTEPTALKQWLTDAQFIRKPLNVGEVQIGKIHEGFLNSVELVWPQLLAFLRSLDLNKKRRLFVGGHSLGAGMSQVATSKLSFQKDGLQPTAVYNFGCPRALNVQGANLYDEKVGSITYRVVNNNDIVCDVPPVVLGFKHVGQLKYLTSDGRVLDDPSSVESGIDKLQGGFSSLINLDPIDIVTDHLPENYTASLTALHRGNR